MKRSLIIIFNLAITSFLFGAATTQVCLFEIGASSDKKRVIFVTKMRL